VCAGSTKKEGESRGCAENDATSRSVVGSTPPGRELCGSFGWGRCDTHSKMTSPHRVLSFTTWFNCPSLEMSGYEVLTRASCFFTKPTSPLSSRRSLALVTSQHVSHPHRYHATYYPTQAYLGAVNDTHLRHSVEVCEAGTGEVKVRHRLPPLPFARHPTLDASLAWLSGEDERALRAALQGGGVSLESVDLAQEVAREGGAVSVLGHFLQGSGEEGAMLPRVIPGRVFHRSAAQVFLKTGTVLEMGTCGGAVMGEGGVGCVGMVEGIVPQPSREGSEGGGGLQAKAQQLLGGCAVIIEPPQLRELFDVELQ
jgi:hypothetical protein